jgi:hypothetical protein
MFWPNHQELFFFSILFFFQFSDFIQKAIFFWAGKHVLILPPKNYIMANIPTPHPKSTPPQKKFDQASIFHHKLFGMPLPLCNKNFLFALFKN